jgi:hypothetical protein
VDLDKIKTPGISAKPDHFTPEEVWNLRGFASEVGFLKCHLNREQYLLECFIHKLCEILSRSNPELKDELGELQNQYAEGIKGEKESWRKIEGNWSNFRSKLSSSSHLGKERLT